MTHVGAGFLCREHVGVLLLLPLLLSLLLPLLLPRQLRPARCIGGATGWSCCRKLHHGAIRWSIG